MIFSYIIGSCNEINFICLLCNAGSNCNSSMLTFDGVDVMGDRLAEEVRNGLFIHFIISSSLPLMQLNEFTFFIFILPAQSKNLFICAVCLL